MDPDSKLAAAVRSLSLEKPALVNVTLVCVTCGDVLYMDNCKKGVYTLGQKTGGLCQACLRKNVLSFYLVRQISCKLNQ